MSITFIGTPTESEAAVHAGRAEHDGEGEDHDVDEPVASRAAQVLAVLGDAALDRRQQRPLPAGHRGIAWEGSRHGRLNGKRRAIDLKSLLAVVPKASAGIDRRP